MKTRQEQGTGVGADLTAEVTLEPGLKEVRKGPGAGGVYRIQLQKP